MTPFLREISVSVVNKCWLCNRNYCRTCTSTREAEEWPRTFYLFLKLYPFCTVFKKPISPSDASVLFREADCSPAKPVHWPAWADVGRATRRTVPALMSPQASPHYLLPITYSAVKAPGKKKSDISLGSKQHKTVCAAVRAGWGRIWCLQGSLLIWSVNKQKNKKCRFVTFNYHF